MYHNGSLVLLNMNLKLGTTHRVLNISRRGQLLQEDRYCQRQEEYFSEFLNDNGS